MQYNVIDNTITHYIVPHYIICNMIKLSMPRVIRQYTHINYIVQYTHRYDTTKFPDLMYKIFRRLSSVPMTSDNIPCPGLNRLLQARDRSYSKASRQRLPQTLSIQSQTTYPTTCVSTSKNTSMYK